MKKILIGIIFLIPTITFAQSYPTSWQEPGSAGATDYSFGSIDMMWSHTATTSLIGITSFEPYLCTSGSVYTGGTFTLEAWYNGTTSPYTQVATSTINASSIVICTGGGLAYNGSTTRFQFNQSFNATIGDTLYFKIRANGITGGGVLYMRGDRIATATHFPWYTSSTSGKFTFSGDQIDTFAKIGSGLTNYSTSWQDLVNASKADDCTGVINCAFAWAFYPSYDSLAIWRSLSLASTSPWGYIYDIKNKFTNYASYATTTALISANLTPFMGTTIGSSSISIAILSAGSMQSVLGGVWTFIQTIFGYALWVGFGWYLWERRKGIV